MSSEDFPGPPPRENPLHTWQPYVLSAIGGILGSLFESHFVLLIGAYVPPVWYLAVAYENTSPREGRTGEILGGSIIAGFAGLIAGIVAKDWLR